MPTRALKVHDQWAPFNVLYRWVFAHGYVRVPLILGFGLTWATVNDKFFDNAFASWNQGNTQADIWNYVERRTKEKNAAEVDEE